MKRRMLLLLLCLSPVPLLVEFHAARPTGGGDPAYALHAVGQIAIEGVRGRLDHIAVDPAGRRMFVAAAGGDTVAVLDRTRSRTIRVLSGFHEPQGVAVVPVTGRLFVANGGDGTVDVFDAATLRIVRRVALGGDADNIRYDARRSQVLVGYGSGGIAVLSREGALSGKVALPGHPEAFEAEASGPRLFVNVPEAHRICVVDRSAEKVTSAWDVPVGSNFPMALDEARHRLFVGCRRPSVLLVYDTRSGRQVTRLALEPDADDVWYDARTRRLYASCGSGVVTIWAQRSADEYAPLDTLPTAPGARTSLFVPGERRLYVAIPSSGPNPAVIRVFAVPG